MSHDRPSDVGFCVVDSNADLIADTLVRRLRETAAEMESEVNRLYRGRNAYDLNAVAKLDLEKTIKSSLEKQGFERVSATCPDDIEAKKGTNFTCEAKADGKNLEIRGKQNADDGERISFERVQ